MVKLNRLKKFLCSAVMAVVALTSVGAVMPVVEVSATQIWWKQGDVDGNGTVNLTDYVVFNRYFNGVQSPTETYVTRMDLNENKIVDTQDQLMLKNYNLGIGTLNSTGKYRDLLTNLYTENRTYLKHLANQSSTTYTEYSLNLQNNLNMINGDSINSLPTAQLNTTLYPETEQSIVSIGNANSVWGTGFIIDKHTIATAAHCVCEVQDDENITFLSNMKVKIYPANANLYNAVAVYDVKAVHVPKQFMTEYDFYHNSNGYTNSYISYFDYAIVEVEEDLSQYGFMSVGCMTNEFIGESNDVMMSGFTSDNEHTWGRYYESGFVLSSPVPLSVILYSASLGGQSGGPVYYQENASSPKIVVGINSFTNGTYSYSPRIIPSTIRFWFANDNLVYYQSNMNNNTGLTE